MSGMRLRSEKVLPGRNQNVGAGGDSLDARSESTSSSRSSRRMIIAQMEEIRKQMNAQLNAQFERLLETASRSSRSSRSHRSRRVVEIEAEVHRESRQGNDDELSLAEDAEEVSASTPVPAPRSKPPNSR
uniref:Uncharacterized protein n=1 Tax=Lygus hesperus TaxID=30085 RepID=A0A0K8SMT6_LYGHE